MREEAWDQYAARVAVLGTARIGYERRRRMPNKHAVFCSQPGAALVVAARFEVAARVLARAAGLHVVVGLAEEGRVADVQGEAGGLGCEAVPA